MPRQKTRIHNTKTPRLTFPSRIAPSNRSTPAALVCAWCSSSRRLTAWKSYNAELARKRIVCSRVRLCTESGVVVAK